MDVGKVYMLRGGLILRYQGPWGNPKAHRPNPNPCLAFRRVSESVSDPASAYSAVAEDVLYEITPDRLPMIQFRREQLLLRDLLTEVEDMDVLIAELSKS